MGADVGSGVSRWIGPDRLSNESGESLLPPDASRAGGGSPALTGVGGGTVLPAGRGGGVASALATGSGGGVVLLAVLVAPLLVPLGGVASAFAAGIGGGV